MELWGSPAWQPQSSTQELSWGVPGTSVGLSAPRQVGSQARELLGPGVAAPRGALLPHGPKNLLHHGASASSWPAAGRFI